ncbi:MAG TPA: VanW family protein [Actinomycetes bacterium]|nr:VanW family protein [Actinomycetes bacterium]
MNSGTARRVGVAVGTVLAVLVAFYVVGLVVVGGDIPRGTSVAGVEIGGLTPDAATQRLEDELGPRAVDVDVELAGKVHTLPAARLGLSFDAAATVDSIEERSLRPWLLAQQLAGLDVAPVVVAEPGRVEAAVARLTRRVDKPTREGRVKYDGLDVVSVEPKAGMTVNRTAAVAAITSGYLTADDPIVLPIVTVEPEVTAEQVQETADGAAVDAISAPVRLAAAGHTMVVSPREIAESVSFRSDAGELAAHVNIADLRGQLESELATIGTPARDASFDVSSGKPVVVPAKRGEGVSDDALASGMTAALGDDARSADISVGPITADLTTSEAKDLGVKQVISTYTQVFPYAAYRVTNIGVASKSINGTVLEPGETFSMNGVVGERTPENGFVKGYIIVGNRLVEDYGGAVSTITTAMWHTAFYAGMTRVEQRAHGFWISRYTAGLEATVSWGNLDLRFRNDTPYGVLITTSVTDTSVTVTMWSTKYWHITAEFGPRTNPTPSGTVYDDGEGCVPQYGVDGFDITVTRVWSRDGEVKRREPLDTSYEAAPTVICAPKPSPSPTPTPDPTDKTDKPKPSPSSSGSDGGNGSGNGTGGGSGNGSG